MNTRNLIVALMLASLAGGQCFAQANGSEEPDEDFDSLAVWVEGNFSSGLHHENDSTYADIDVHMKRIWHHREDGAWFYGEQAFASTPDAPYKQLVYKMSRVEEGMFEGVVYSIGEAADSVVGAWKDTTLLEQLSYDDIRAQIGCEVYFQATGVSYIGGTHGTACRSSVKGLSYVVSEITIEYDRLVVWERGYDSRDEQVWGAEKRPYWFFRE